MTTATPRWQVGDRVLAAFPPTPNGWYAGTITALDGDEASIDYDDGDKATVRLDRVAPLDFAAGLRVMGRWQGGTEVYPGTVTEVGPKGTHVLYDDGDTEWAEAKYLCVPHGGRVRVKQDDVLVHERCDDTSPIVGAVTREEEVVLGPSYRVDGKDWTEAVLPGGPTGYVHADVAVQAIRQVALLQQAADLHSAPAVEAPVIGGLRKGDVFWLLDTMSRDGERYHHVQTDDGTRGYVDGNVLTRELHEPEPTWWRSATTGATFLLSKAVAAAVLLLVRGDLTAAIAAVGICVISGALAGTVHYLTLPWRRYALGHHLSWVLVLGTYCLVALACLAVLERFGAEKLIEVVGRPHYLALFGCALLVVALYLGYSGQAAHYQAHGLSVPGSAWLVPVIGAGGAAMVFAGLAYLWVGGKDWAFAHAADVEPQELTLAELIRDGFGGNRHVRVTGFRYCDQRAGVGRRPARRIAVLEVWTPVVPAAGIGKEAPKVPGRVHVVLRDHEFLLGNPVRAGVDLNAAPRRQREQQGYTGVITSGLKELPTKVRQQIAELAPQTDPAELIVIDSGVKPIPVERVRREVLRGAALAVTGVVVFLIALSWGWRLEKQTAAELETL